jgi:hypothetical protein
MGFIQWSTLIIFRILGHAALTWHVFSDRDNFANQTIFYASFGGMLCLNALNVKMAVDLFVMGPAGSRVVHIGGKKE